MYFHNKYFRLDNYRYGTETIAPAVESAPKRKRNKEVRDEAATRTQTRTCGGDRRRQRHRPSHRDPIRQGRGGVVASDVDLTTAQETAQIIHGKGHRAVAFQLDVTDPAAWERFAEQVRASTACPMFW